MPFTIDPTKCRIQYVCESVTSADPAQLTGIPECSDFTFDGMLDGDDTDGKFTFTPTRDDYINGDYIPGTYTVTIKGTAIAADVLTEDTADFDIILTDPCDPPTITPPADLIDQVYTLTDNSKADYVTAAWTISPDYCELDFT